MSYSAYSSNSYGPINEVLKQAYDGSVMGQPYAADCPVGGIVGHPQQQQQQRADVIPVTTPPNGAGLAQIATQAYSDTVSSIPVTAFQQQCCNTPPPCDNQVAWQAKFKGCPVTYFADDATQQCEVAPLGDRYWVADINPLLCERQMMQQAEPNPYDFMNARQMWMQFLMKDNISTKDPYTRRVSDLGQTYCAQLKTQGPPQYTTF